MQWPRCLISKLIGKDYRASTRKQDRNLGVIKSFYVRGDAFLESKSKHCPPPRDDQEAKSVFHSALVFCFLINWNRWKATILFFRFQLSSFEPSPRFFFEAISASAFPVFLHFFDRDVLRESRLIRTRSSVAGSVKTANLPRLFPFSRVQLSRESRRTGGSLDAIQQGQSVESGDRQQTPITNVVN